MRINKTRIRNVRPYLTLLKEGEEFYVSLQNISSYQKSLEKVGFSKKCEIGEQLLPRAVGKITQYNSEGRYIIHRDKPKETVYRQSEWRWTDWGGYEHSKIVDIPYKRYPRTFVEPPSEELIISDNNGVRILLSRKLKNDKESIEAITHIVNIFLEAFGECDIVKTDLLPPIKAKAIRLNWTLLPPGKYPWDKVKKEVKSTIEQHPKGNQPVIEHRVESISKFNPDFVAIGNGGFNGYLVFGFSKKKLFVLESTWTGNATYVFKEDWEKLSQLTKREIISNSLQEDRIIHREGWNSKIKTLLS